jgi:hypothetical protein
MVDPTDPFSKIDPKWETFELAREEDIFCMPDLASRNMGDFIRSLVPKDVEPTPEPQPDTGRLPHITGFPG